MHRVFGCIIVLLALVVHGCSGPETADNDAAEGSGSTASAASNEAGNEVNEQTSGAPAEAGESIVSGGTNFALTPENTKIQFVGTHVGDKPDPRKGGFEKLSGNIVYQSDGLVSSINVDIDTASLYTEIEKLTQHLKGADFFDVREHPSAAFKSTNIAAQTDGTMIVTGQMTLLGVTKEISFPAMIMIDQSLTLEAEFEIDRTEFGMDYGPDRVEKIVTMTIKVG